MKAQSKTDWERVKREAAAEAPIAFDPAIDPYDPNDARAVAAHWEGATIKQDGVELGQVRTRGPSKRPTKEQVAVRYSPEVLAYFRATGAGWQTRIDEVLREYVAKHRAAA